ncbi:MAG: hypothetical protein ACYTG0_35415 [Planctomycetota bacterium]
MLEQTNAFVRSQLEIMVDIARRNPRDEQQAAEAVMAELEAWPKLATRNFYVIPYRQKDHQTGGWKTVNVTGGSIRAAMTLERHWGNCDDGGMVGAADEDRIQVIGLFIDYQRGIRKFRPHAVSRYQKKKGGGIELMDPQRLGIAIQAGVSKSIRNAVFNGLPDWYIEQFVGTAMRMAGEGAALPRTKGGNPPTLAARRKAALEHFAKRYHIDEAMLEEYIGLPAAKWKEPELTNLLGLSNALDAGEVTVQSVWSKDKGVEGDFGDICDELNKETSG